MLTRVLTVGLLAGLLAGLLVAVLQQATTAPLILAAEVYEKPAETQPAAGGSGGHHHDGHAAHDEGWKPENGLPRFFFTSIATVATAVGISFLLIAGMLFAGDAIDERRSLAWAIAGFVAAGLAPAVGLAPELPGSAVGDLVGRQIWWVGTAVATALALWMFLRAGNVLTRVVAVVVLVAPHVIGAPHPHAFESRAPAELAAHFAALSLVVQALLWAFAGIAVGLLWPRFAPRSAS
ncbi:MAG: CbtA family protein [Reyranellales bacterium]